MLDFTYSYQLPNFYAQGSLTGDFTNGWSLTGANRSAERPALQRDRLSGAVGSVYYSIFDGINNPIVPLATGCTPKSAMTGAFGRLFGNGDACFKP